MIALQWRLAILALFVLPLFLIPSRSWGASSSAITREQMNLNAGMNTHMTERFNVAGALLAKLFGRPLEERESFSAARGAFETSASGSRSTCALLLLARVSSPRSAPPSSTGGADASASAARSRSARSCAFTIYLNAALRAAHAADERARRPA